MTKLQSQHPSRQLSLYSLCENPFDSVFLYRPTTGCHTNCCEAWSISLSQEHKLQVLENRGLMILCFRVK